MQILDTADGDAVFAGLETKHCGRVRLAFKNEKRSLVDSLRQTRHGRRAGAQHKNAGSPGRLSRKPDGGEDLRPSAGIIGQHRISGNRKRCAGFSTYWRRCEDRGRENPCEGFNV
jgi:hypothetical protein